MGAPDMRMPIAHCLGFPERLAAPTPRLDLAALGSLTFERPDFDRFPSLRLALDALAAGGGMSTVLNAANELAVEAFLAGRIAFGGIARHVADALDAALKLGHAKEPATVADALGVDHIVRERSRAILAGHSLRACLRLSNQAGSRVAARWASACKELESNGFPHDH